MKEEDGAEVLGHVGREGHALEAIGQGAAAALTVVAGAFTPSRPPRVRLALDAGLRLDLPDPARR